VRAAQRSQILDGHRSEGYARQRVSLYLPRRASFYNAWASEVTPALAGASSTGGKTGENGAYEVAGSVTMHRAKTRCPSLLGRPPVPFLEIVPGVTLGKMVSPGTKEDAGNPNGIAGAMPLSLRASMAKKQFAVGIEYTAQGDSCLAQIGMHRIPVGPHRLGNGIRVENRPSAPITLPFVWIAGFRVSVLLERLIRAEGLDALESCADVGS
jgi:hypothetical protein